MSKSPGKEEAKGDSVESLRALCGAFEEQVVQLEQQLLDAMLANEQMSKDIQALKAAQAGPPRLERTTTVINEAFENIMTNEFVLVDSTQSPVKKTTDATTSPLVAAAEPPARTTAADLRKKASTVIKNVLWHFIVDPEELPKPSDPPALGIAVLKDNLGRFTRHVRDPIKEGLAHVARLQQWANPSASLLATVVWFYATWTGYLIPVLILYALFGLFQTYLYALTHPDELPDARPIEDHSGAIEKMQLLQQVATLVQNALGTAADFAEKIRNGLTWRAPTHTIQIVKLLVLLFFFTCYVSVDTFMRLVFFALGLKFFILDYVFAKYPRVKMHHDTTAMFIKTLPTDKELASHREQKAADLKMAAATKAANPPDRAPHALVVPNPPTETELAEAAIRARFNIPTGVQIVDSWHCARFQNSWLSSGIVGRVILTTSGVFFEAKWKGDEDVTIEFSTVTSIKKHKVVSVMPGKGMALLITLTTGDSFVFGAMMARDTAFAAIIEQCQRSGHKLDVIDGMATLVRPPVGAGASAAPAAAASTSPTKERKNQ